MLTLVKQIKVTNTASNPKRTYRSAENTGRGRTVSKTFRTITVYVDENVKF